MESCRHEMKVGSYIVARDFGQDGGHGLPKTEYSIRSSAICKYGGTSQLELGVALMVSYTRRIEFNCVVEGTRATWQLSCNSRFGMNARLS